MMKHLKNHLLFLFLFLTLTWACKNEEASKDLSVSSPNQKIKLSFALNSKGEPYYMLDFNDKKLVDTSYLGFKTKDFDLLSDFSVVNSSTQTIDETWKPVWGQQSEVRNHCQELKVNLKDSKGHLLDIVFRVFDEGLGFRYEFPAQNGLDALVILDEVTQYKMTADHTAFWNMGCWDNDEYWYSQTKLSEIDSSRANYNSLDTWMSVPTSTAASLPLTLRTAEDVHLTFHEAALVDFTGHILELNPKTLTLKTSLAPAPDGTKATVALPAKTPWRTIQIGASATDLLATYYLLENLNEPNKIQNTDWIKPTKYAGIWWEMHVGKATWDKASGMHGATTENAKKYIDFCAKYGIPAFLVEGWNTGWEVWTAPGRATAFDFTTPYKDFDIREVIRYGKEKGVALIGHHETSAAVNRYNERIDSALAFYNEVGVHAVKTGYVGSIIPKGYTHKGQWMVNHYNTVMKKMADAKIMLDVHEPIYPTGLCRTYPNLMSAEGMCGQEFNAWSRGNPISHNVTLPFMRNLIGPMDFTPGVFDVAFQNSKNERVDNGNFFVKEGNNRVKSTIMQQLALYVVFYSPLQMLADLPENYEEHPDALKFIQDVAVDWDKTVYLNAKVGEYASIARKAKGTDNWFLGSITGDKAQNFTFKLDFLEEGKTYTAITYRDAADADWEKNPMAYKIESKEVKAGDTLEVKLAKGGGCAISFMSNKL
jgi:hypothetical protein